jgi:hypothetical protein
VSHSKFTSISGEKSISTVRNRNPISQSLCMYLSHPSGYTILYLITDVTVFNVDRVFVISYCVEIVLMTFRGDIMPPFLGQR